MKLEELNAVVRESSDVPNVTEGEVIAHMRAKYPVVNLGNRPVYIFTAEREFGGSCHSVSIHGINAVATPEHIYQYVLLTYCYAGEFKMTMDGAPVTLSAGDCLVADRHVPHGVEATGPNDFAVNIVLNDRFFDEHFLKTATRLGSRFALALSTRNSAHMESRVYQSRDDELARCLVDRILCEKLDPAAGSDDIIDSLAEALLTHLIRTYETDVRSQAELEGRQALIGRVREYVALNYREGNLGKMAAALGYDATYLSAAVRRETGQTFKQLVNEERMKRATMLLQGTKMTVAEVAAEVGVSNLTQFYKRFREYAGQTPNDYRNQ